MARTKQAAGFVGMRAAARSHIEEMGLFVRDTSRAVQAAYVGVMRRAAVRRALHRGGRDHQLDRARSKAHVDTSALMVCAQQMGRFHGAGAPLAELLLIPEVLFEHAYLLAGEAPRGLDAIDLEEERLAAIENVLQMRRRVHGAHEAALLEEAEIRTRLATLNTEAARACRLLAMTAASRSRSVA
jgi:hypothetical protein